MDKQIDETLARVSEEVGFRCVAHGEGQNCCIDIESNEYPILKTALQQLLTEAVNDYVVALVGEKCKDYDENCTVCHAHKLKAQPLSKRSDDE